MRRNRKWRWLECKAGSLTLTRQPSGVNAALWCNAVKCVEKRGEMGFYLSFLSFLSVPICHFCQSICHFCHFDLPFLSFRPAKRAGPCCLIVVSPRLKGL